MSRLTLVTGPAGPSPGGGPYADVGPVCAILGATLDDGLAVRVVQSDPGLVSAHRSPDPHHRHTLDPDAGCQGVADDNCHTSAVILEVLPSAWQNPDTNLAAVYTGTPDLGVTQDLHTLDALGLNPAHRLTVQHGGRHRPLGGGRPFPTSIPEPVEVGNVGEIARDSVLRAGGHVLVEAGDGITALTALALLNLPPWAEWIGQLHLWVTADVSHWQPGADPRDIAAGVAQTVHSLIGGAPAWRQRGDRSKVAVQVALYGLTAALPSLRDLGGTYDTNEVFGQVDGADADRLEVLDKKLIELCGATVGLVHTGADVQSRVRRDAWLDLRDA